jgi:vacuolar-type H+-ATPase subunit E/Vma4
MGLDELREGILEKAREKARDVSKAQDRELAKLLADAEAQRKQLLEKGRAEAKQLSAEERREAVANAHLEAKREMAKARDEYVVNVEADVRSEFLKEARGKQYPENLRKLVEKARRELGGEVTVHLAKEDRKLLGEMKGVHVAEKPLDVEGGALIVSADGRVSVNATLEALFEERRDRVRQEINKTLLKERE